MKITGKQWNDFLESWPEAWWYDDAEVSVNGVVNSDLDEVKPTDKVEFSCGVLIKGDGTGDESVSLVGAARKWLRAQSHEHVVVELPKSVNKAAFLSMLKAFDARVIK